jgi:hypothetical protein
MPGLIRGIARTAVVAGTATAVSNRVSRRQAGRWAEQDAQAYQQQAAYQQPPPAAYAQPAYAPPAYAQPAPADQPPPAPAAADAPPADDMTAKLAQLQQLGELHEQGILTDEEFQAQKAKILGN